MGEEDQERQRAPVVPLPRDAPERVDEGEPGSHHEDGRATIGPRAPEHEGQREERRKRPHEHALVHVLVREVELGLAGEHQLDDGVIRPEPREPEAREPCERERRPDARAGPGAPRQSGEAESQEEPRRRVRDERDGRDEDRRHDRDRTSRPQPPVPEEQVDQRDRARERGRVREHVPDRDEVVEPAVDPRPPPPEQQHEEQAVERSARAASGRQHFDEEPDAGEEQEQVRDSGEAERAHAVDAGDPRDRRDHEGVRRNERVRRVDSELGMRRRPRIRRDLPHHRGMLPEVADPGLPDRLKDRVRDEQDGEEEEPDADPADPGSTHERLVRRAVSFAAARGFPLFGTCSLRLRLGLRRTAPSPVSRARASPARSANSSRAPSPVPGPSRRPPRHPSRPSRASRRTARARTSDRGSPRRRAASSA